MDSRFGLGKVGRCQEYSDSNLHREPSFSPLNELPHSTSWWANREEHRDQGDSLREQIKEMDEHVARLQDMLRCEQAKCTRLQLQYNQQEAELRLRELHSNRLKERLSQLTDGTRQKGPSIEVLNFPPGSKSEQPIKSSRTTAKLEETALRMMLERREAELREAMKLRHSLTTLLHALRVDMEQTMLNLVDMVQNGNKSLDQTEAMLGEHVTGGVVQSWRQAQKTLWNLLSEGQTPAGTDHDKLLAQLEAELKESQKLVRLQQQLLQDSFISPVPSQLADSYFLEEWERLQMHWAEFNHQKKTFEKERQSFTDAAIRLSHERHDFEKQKASLVKQQYLRDSPGNNRRESTALNFSVLGSNSISGCLPVTPSSMESGTSAAPGLPQQRAGVHTPSTPELYSALDLPYNCRSKEVDHHSETWDSRTDKMMHTAEVPHLDGSF